MTKQAQTTAPAKKIPHDGKRYGVNPQMAELIQNIQRWASDRNLLMGSTPMAQSLKLAEESGELAKGVTKGDKPLIKDAIGDTAVVAIIMATQMGFDPVGMLSTGDKGSLLRHGERLAGMTKVYADVSIVGSVNRGVCDIMGVCFDSAQDNAATLHHDLVNLLLLLKVAANHYGLTYTECLRFAYNEIKDRKGKMVDGVFVKEAV